MILYPTAGGLWRIEAETAGEQGRLDDAMARGRPTFTGERSATRSHPSDPNQNTAPEEG